MNRTRTSTRTLKTLLATLILAATILGVSSAQAATTVNHTVTVDDTAHDIAVALDPTTGRTAAVWQQENRLRITLYDADGSLIAGPKQVASPPAGRSARQPDIAWAPTGWVVVYSSDEAPSADDEFDIRVAVYTHDLTFSGVDFVTSPAGPNHQDEIQPAITRLEDADELIVAWHSSVEFGAGRYESIRTRPLDDEGFTGGPATTIINEVFLTSVATQIGFPAIGSHRTGNGALVATFADLNEAGLAAGEFEVVARTVNASGQPTAPLQRLTHFGVDGEESAPFGFESRTPAVAMAGPGFVVATRGIDDMRNDIVARVIGSTGVPSDDDEQVLSDVSLSGIVDLAPTDAGLVVAVSGVGPAAVAPEVRTQRLAVIDGAIVPLTEMLSAAVPTHQVVALDATASRSVIGYAKGGAEIVLLSETTPVDPTQPLAEKAGYWMLDTAGGLFEFGDAVDLGDIVPAAASNAIDVDATPSGDGLWVLASAGQVTALGDAIHHGDIAGDLDLAGGEQPRALAPTAEGDGYWIFTSTGRAAAFGGAVHHGDMSGLPLNGSIVDAVPTVSGDGYWMLGEDGGVFSFGGASFHGSTGDLALNAPAVGMVADPDGVGYWFVASDGGVFSFEAEFKGSMGAVPLNEPVVGMITYGDGYAMIAADGGAFVFSSTPFLGSLGGTALEAPIVALTAMN